MESDLVLILFWNRQKKHQRTVLFGHICSHSHCLADSDNSQENPSMATRRRKMTEGSNTGPPHSIVSNVTQGSRSPHMPPSLLEPTYRAETQLSKPSHKATDKEARAVWCGVPLYWPESLNPSCLDSGLHIALEQVCLHVESRPGSTMLGDQQCHIKEVIMQFAHKITWPDWNLPMSPYFPSHVSHTALASWHPLENSFRNKVTRVE